MSAGAGSAGTTAPPHLPAVTLLAANAGMQLAKPGGGGGGNEGTMNWSKHILQVAF
jgi:hypothetical protein